MTSNRGHKNNPPAFPGAPTGPHAIEDAWGDDEETFDRPTIIPDILPTEADLIAGRLPIPPTKPPPSIAGLDDEWEHPSAVIERAPSDPALAGSAELEFDLDDLGPPSSPFAPPKGPGKARPISVSGLSPLGSPRGPSAPAATPRSAASGSSASSRATTPAHTPLSKASLASLPRSLSPAPMRAAAPAAAPSSRVAAPAPAPSSQVAPIPAPPPRAPAATLVADDPLAFDLQFHADLDVPRRESFPDDFDLDFEAIRNPKMRQAPTVPPAPPTPEESEPHTAPYPFELDPSHKSYAAGHFRQPPPVAAPTSPLEDLGRMPGEEGAPKPVALRPLMGERPSPGKPASPASSLLQEMRDKFALGDFSGSLKAAETLLERSPAHEEASRFADSCRSRLCGMYEAKLGSLTKVPRVILPPEQVRWLSLDHRAGFILSCVDGYSSIEEILDVSGMPQIDALRILHDLLVQKVISVPLAGSWRAPDPDRLPWRPPQEAPWSCSPSPC